MTSRQEELMNLESARSTGPIIAGFDRAGWTGLDWALEIRVPSHFTAAVEDGKSQEGLERSPSRRATAFAPAVPDPTGDRPSVSSDLPGVEVGRCIWRWGVLPRKT